MDDSYEDIENRIFEAMWKAKRVKRPNMAALAREFCVPVSRLRARFQGTPSKKGNSNAKKTLDDAQEAALGRWIERLDDLNIHPDPPDINEMANLILFRQFESDMHTRISAHKDAYDSNADNEPQPSLVGKTWVYRFIKRLPEELRPRIEQPIESERAYIDPAETQHWFDRLEPIIKATKTHNIYNFDETGFILGETKRQRVISRQKRPQAASDCTRESLTAVECVSADGWVAPPFFIFKGQAILERWFKDNMNPDWVVAMAPKGFITDKLAFEWLQHFDQHTRYRVEKSKL